jgi:hypothetical protein
MGMADLSKLKRRNKLGSPPPLDEASRNLIAPETAPVSDADSQNETVPLRHSVAGEKPREPPSRARRRIDGRSLRKTGRTLQFATRVTPEFDDTLRRAAGRDRLLIVEVLERALALYEAAQQHGAGKKIAAR